MQKEKIKGVAVLGCVIAGVWSLMGYALPLVTQSFDMTKQLADYIDKEDIETGQFYYTGVEIIGRAEAGARGSIAFTEMRKSALEELELEVDDETE